MLFQIAAVLSPTKAETDAGLLEEIIVEPRWVVAANNQVAAMIATRAVDAKYETFMDRVHVFVRPF